MPRNEILPPISFVADLSISGKNLIEKVVDSQTKNSVRDQIPSFSERLRSQRSESHQDRKAVISAKEPRETHTSRKNHALRASTARDVLSDRKEQLEKHRPAVSGETSRVNREPVAARKDSLITENDRTEVSSIERRHELANNKIRKTEQATSRDVQQENKIVEEFGDTKDAHEVKSASGTQKNTGEQEAGDLEQSVKIDDSKKEISSTEIPIALVKHITQNFSDHPQQTEVAINPLLQIAESDQQQVPLAGLANALQKQLSSQQQLVENQPDSDANSEAALLARQQEGVQEVAEIFPTNLAAPEYIGATIENSENLNGEAGLKEKEATSGTQTLEQEAGAIIVDENLSEQQILKQESLGEVEFVAKTEQELLATANQISTSVTGKDKSAAVLDRVVKTVSEDQSNEGVLQKEIVSNSQEKQSEQGQQTESLQNEHTLQDHLDSQSSAIRPLADNSRSEVPKEVVREEKRADSSVSVSQTDAISEQKLNVTPEIKELEKITSTDTASEDIARFEQVPQEKTSSSNVTGAQYTQQQTAVAGHVTSSFNQAVQPIVNGIVEPAPLENLLEKVSQTVQNKTAEATESQKSFQVESSNSIASSPSARVSTEPANIASSRAVLDTTRSDVSQKLASFLQQASESGKPMRIRLNPPELGTLQIEVGRLNGQVVARLEVENPAVRTLLLEQMQILRDTLQQQGLRVDRVEVEVNEGLTQDFSSDQSDEQRAEEQQQRFSENSEFDTENSLHEQGDSEEEKSEVPRVVGVSEIDVQV